MGAWTVIPNCLLTKTLSYRSLFPAPSYEITGLSPQNFYSFGIELALVDHNTYRWKSADKSWSTSIERNVEDEDPTHLFMHPEGAKRGGYWLVSLRWLALSPTSSLTQICQQEHQRRLVPRSQGDQRPFQPGPGLANPGRTFRTLFHLSLAHVCKVHPAFAYHRAWNTRGGEEEDDRELCGDRVCCAQSLFESGYQESQGCEFGIMRIRHNLFHRLSPNSRRLCPTHSKTTPRHTPPANSGTPTAPSLLPNPNPNNLPTPVSKNAPANLLPRKSPNWTPATPTTLLRKRDGRRGTRRGGR